MEGSSRGQTSHTSASRDSAPAHQRTGGTKQLARTVWDEFRDDDVPGQAAKVAYFAFLALPPSFMVLFSLAGFFGGEGVANWITGRLGTALPETASDLVTGFVDQVVHQNAPGALSIGLLLALWGASNVFMGLGDALNTAYDVEDERPWWKRRLLAIGVMLAFMVLFLGGSTLLILGPQIAAALGLGGVAKLAWDLVQWPAAIALVVIAFWIVYRTLPARDQSRHNAELLKSAGIAAMLWVVVTLGFRIYIANFGSYSETYGFLGAVIVLLLWLYLTAVVVLTGGELASEMERQA